MTTATTSKQSAEERALERFGEMLISKIETINEDWHKPWFTEGACVWARNLDGRGYNGINAFMLAMLCENKGYELPVFSTFERIAALNNKKIKDDKPMVTVKKGEKSFPVFLTVFVVVHRETKEKIPYDEYLKLSENEKEKYNVYPSTRVYNVFNIAQTNIKEILPEFYEKCRVACQGKRPEIEAGTMFSIEEVDYMLNNQKWYCAINPTYGDDAYYSISKDEIVVPQKKQFADGESFYGTLFHEMSHSTGAESRLNRLKPTSFGSKEYATEELVAEISAALVCMSFGIQKYVKEDSVAYLKGWLKSLGEDKAFIKTVLKDAKKASDMIIDRLENLDKVIVKPKVA